MFHQVIVTKKFSALHGLLSSLILSSLLWISTACVPRPSESGTSLPMDRACAYPPYCSTSGRSIQVASKQHPRRYPVPRVPTFHHPHSPPAFASCVFPATPTTMFPKPYQSLASKIPATHSPPPPPPQRTKYSPRHSTITAVTLSQYYSSSINTAVTALQYYYCHNTTTIASSRTDDQHRARAPRDLKQEHKQEPRNASFTDGPSTNKNKTGQNIVGVQGHATGESAGDSVCPKAYRGSAASQSSGGVHLIEHIHMSTYMTRRA